MNSLQYNLGIVVVNDGIAQTKTSTQLPEPMMSPPWEYCLIPREIVR